MVWVPSRDGGGVCAALEAMAAGRPVVATRVPELEEIIVDGETGFLVRRATRPSLARQTRLLLDDAALASRLGSGRETAREERFGAARDGRGVCADLRRIQRIGVAQRGMAVSSNPA